MFYLSIYQSINLFIYLSIDLCISIWLSSYLSIDLSTYLSIYPSIYLSPPARRFVAMERMISEPFLRVGTWRKAIILTDFWDGEVRIGGKYSKKLTHQNQQKKVDTNTIN